MQNTLRLLYLCIFLTLLGCQKSFEPTLPSENDLSSNEFLTERNSSFTQLSGAVTVVDHLRIFLTLSALLSRLTIH